MSSRFLRILQAILMAGASSPLYAHSSGHSSHSHSSHSHSHSSHSHTSHSHGSSGHSSSGHGAAARGSRVLPIENPPTIVVRGRGGRGDRGEEGPELEDFGFFATPPLWSRGIRTCWACTAAGYEVLDREGREDWAAIVFKVVPDDAEVVLDGQVVGEARDFDGSSGLLTVAPGEHRIELRHTGYDPLQVYLDADPGEEISVVEFLVVRI